ncbi:MAG: fumarylacetoacetate hydrolase family protein [Ekhidna sp.]
MRIKRVIDTQKTEALAVYVDGQWKLLDTSHGIVDLLDANLDESLSEFNDFDESEYTDLIPMKPAAYRDFMLFEKHAIDATRGFVKKYMPKLLPIVKAYEGIFRKPFPKLKPKSRYYQHPIYYMGNHLNFITHNDTIQIPSYTEELDYELEIAAIITKPLKNATPEEVEQAIGGFVILNDFSARDVQISEMESGFGPMKTKNFGSSISSHIVSREELINRLQQLKTKVHINEQLVAEGTTEGMYYSIQEAIAYASWEEQLHPGELFGSGTVPGCTGIENGIMLKRGDTITLAVEGLGQLTNQVV